ncbi:MAG TPA: HAMP domain-containing sensor histidine kinase [Ktedonobacteraceae bacterium]
MRSFATQIQHFILSCLQYDSSRLPRWRQPLVGYLVSIFFIIGSVTLDTLGRSSHLLTLIPGLGLYFYFTTVIITFFWGFGPSMLALLSGFLVVDYFYIQPTADALHYDALEDLANAAAFIIAGMLTVIVVHRREAAHIRAQTNESIAQQSQQQLENFIGIVCHELKTPIAAASGRIQFAERKLRRYDTIHPLDLDSYHMEIITEAKNLLESAVKDINVQTHLIDDLLDSSRFHSQQLQLDKRPCLLAQIVREVVERERYIAPTRVIHLTLLANEDDTCIQGDPNRISQVVTNYLNNALKYSPVEKPVHITLKLEDQAAWVLVRDEGPVLPEEEHQRIWDRFYRVSGIEVQRNAGIPYAGLGVGLYICCTIIELHQGQVGLWSQPSAGSTFWFTLPLFQKKNQQE